MRDQLINLLYGGLYDTSPGSDRHREQCRRVEAALELMEVEMAKRKPPKPRPVDDKEKPESFRSKIVKKFVDEDEAEEASGDGV